MSGPCALSCRAQRSLCRGPALYVGARARIVSDWSSHGCTQIGRSGGWVGLGVRGGWVACGSELGPQCQGPAVLDGWVALGVEGSWGPADWGWGRISRSDGQVARGSRAVWVASGSDLGLLGARAAGWVGRGSELGAGSQATYPSAPSSDPRATQPIRHCGFPAARRVPFSQERTPNLTVWRMKR